MSTVDNRVVNLGFNNQQFEQGVQTSIKSLGNLKKGLDLEQSTRSLNNLSSVSRSFSLDGISDGVANISNRFSAMGIVGFTVLQNLTNSAMGLTEKLIKSALGVEEIKAGFASYEVKVNAVKTVMAGTGESIDSVTQSLNELNNYSDRTVYSFQDMTENISKFTNAGMNSKQAAIAIQGISNVAAISGAGTQEAARAMYNFGQAIQQGSVRLMDWKSIENANMATIGFKEQLLLSAVAAGTLTKAVDGTYKTLSGEVLSATKNFNGSLEKEWLTTKVLTDTLANYASQTTDIGKKANAAAQDVTTFTQMMATAQDSTKTGWTKTSQIIFGDLNESKALFTEISGIMGNFISASANSRNKLLTDWKMFNGRTSLIDALRNSFEGLMSILDPIKQAFNSIFPPTTGYQLASISYAIKKLTENFKMGEENAEKLKRTFYGIFAVFDLLKTGILIVAEGFLKLVGAIAPSSDSILDITAKIGDFLLETRNAIRFGKGWDAEVFKPIREGLAPTIKAFQDFSNAISPVIEFIKTAAKDVFNVLEYKIGGGDWHEGLVGPVGSALLDVFYYLDEFSRNASPIIEKISGWFKNLFPKKVDTSGAESALEIFGGKVATRFSPLAKIFEATGKVLGWFGEVLIKLWPILSKVGELIVTGIGKLGTTIMDSVNNLDFEKVIDVINTGLLAAFVLLVKKFVGGDGVGAVKGILGGITGVLDGVQSSLTAWQTNLKAKTIMTIATAIAILAVSLIALSLVDSAKLTKALTAVTAMFIELVTTMETIGKVPGGKNVSMIAGQLILISAAVGILSLSVIALSRLDPKKLTTGLIGVGVILTELVLFMKVTKIDGLGATKGLGLLILGAALLVIASAVTKLSKIDPDKMRQGLAAIGAILLELAVFTKLTGNNITLVSTAVAMTILGGALLIFKVAVEQLGSLPIHVLVNGLGAMAVVLTEIVIAMKLMPKSMIISAVGMVLVAKAIEMLTGPLTTLGKMSIEEIVKSLAMLAGALGILTLAMMGMKGALEGAGAMVVVAIALAMLTPSLQALGSMSLTEIGLSLLMMAGTFAIFGAAGMILGPLTPVLIQLTSAIALFGLGLFAVGMGVLAFATGMGMLAVSGAAGAAALTLIAASILGLIPMIIAALINGVLTFVTLLVEAAPPIIDALAKIGMSIINGLVILIPGIVSGVLQLVTALLQTLIDNLPKLLDAGWTLLKMLLEGISSHIAEVAKTVITIITKFIDAVSEELPKIIRSGWNLIISFIRGITESLDENLPTLIVELGKFAKGMVDGLVEGLKKYAGQIKDMLLDMARQAWQAVKDFFGFHSPSRLFITLGEGIIAGWVKGLDQNGSDVLNSVTGIAKDSVSAFKNTISQISDGVDSTFEMNPTIRPVVDLSDVIAGGKQVNSIFGNRTLNVSGTLGTVSAVASNMSVPIGLSQTVQSPQGQSISFIQYNNSPKSLSAIDIYRQTRNQLNAYKAKGLV